MFPVEVVGSSWEGAISEEEDCGEQKNKKWEGEVIYFICPQRTCKIEAFTWAYKDYPQFQGSK